MEQLLRDFTLEFCGNGEYKTTPISFFQQQKGILLDVRTKEEFASLSIHLELHDNIESKNIPVSKIPDKFEEIPQNILVAIFCPGSIRASFVYAFLYSKGFRNIKILTGGYLALTEALSSSKICKIVK